MDGRGVDRAWALLLVRGVLGLMFMMAGTWKCFELGPLEHARRLFVEPYAETFLPRWSLLATGATVPVVELVAGALVLVGWRMRIALVALGLVLLLVTFGHLLKEPLYAFHAHVVPRLALVVFLLMTPRDDDRFALDALLARRAR